jgi:hypothetical protein
LLWRWGVHLAMLVPLGFSIGNILKNLYCVERPKSREIWLGRNVNEDDYGYPSTHCTNRTFSFHLFISITYSISISVHIELRWTRTKRKNGLIMSFSFVLWSDCNYSTTSRFFPFLSHLLRDSRIGLVFSIIVMVFERIVLARNSVESIISRCPFSWRRHIRRCCRYFKSHSLSLYFSLFQLHESKPIKVIKAINQREWIEQTNKQSINQSIKWQVSLF